MKKTAAEIRLEELLQSDDTEKEVSDSLWEESVKNIGLRRDFFDYWFHNHYKRYDRKRRSAHESSVTKKVRERRAQGKRQVRAVVLQLHNLMDHVMVCGKILRYATFGDCAKEGGWLVELAKLGRANEVVGAKLSSTDVRNIFMRNRKAA